MNALIDLMSADGAVRAFALDESSGTEALDSAKREAGTYAGAHTKGITSPVPGAGGGVSFAGGYIDLGRLGEYLAGAAAITLEMVVRFDELPSVDVDVDHVIFSPINDSNKASFIIMGDTSDYLQCGGRSQDGDAYQSTSTTSLLVTGQWMHVVAVLDFAQAKLALYRAGALVEEVTGLSWGSSTFVGDQGTDAASIAGNLSTGQHADITVAATAIYSSAFTAEQVSRHYDAALIAREVAGTVTVDASPAARVVQAFRQSDGGFLGETTSDAGTGAYAIQTGERGAVVAVCIDDYGEPWRADTAVVTDELAIPTAPNGHWYKAQAAGTTGSTEPVWPTGGGSVVDGGVTWDDQGTMRAPQIIAPYVPTLE